MVEIVCSHCDSIFKRSPSDINDGDNFCSQECWKSNKNIIVECSYCGAKDSITKREYQSKDNHFCNFDCLGSWQSENKSGENHPAYNKVDVSCDNCGEIFKRKPSLVETSEKNFCDMDCRNQSYNDDDDWDFGPKKTKEDIECDNCGIAFEQYPSRVERNEYNFCSKDCHYEFIPKEGLREGKNNPYWSVGETQQYYGPNWENKRKERLKIDNYKCLRCGISNSANKERYGRSLSVHHIIPIKQFNGDYNSANKIQNLVSLCNSCHVVVEVLSPNEQKRILFEGEE